jgi:hypothetical protein
VLANDLSRDCARLASISFCRSSIESSKYHLLLGHRPAKSSFVSNRGLNVQ